jgi:hypothetical protein
MDPSLVPAKVIGGMLALPVRAELTPSGQWHLAIPRPFIADISPDACCGAFLPALHFDRGVIGEMACPLRTYRPIASARGSSSFDD